MSIQEMFDKLVDVEIISGGRLSQFQLADIELSLSWKKQSYYLLDSAKTDDEMIKAVFWCGKNGHALRGLNKEECEKISQELGSRLFGNKYSYSDVIFGCDSGKEITINNKVVNSWVSKICHILNPIGNPIIYDSKTRRFFKVFSKKDWDIKANALLNKYHSEFEKLNMEDAYIIDSIIWALDGDRNKSLEMVPKYS